jgi:hypothetical protein
VVLVLWPAVPGASAWRCSCCRRTRRWCLANLPPKFGLSYLICALYLSRLCMAYRICLVPAACCRSVHCLLLHDTVHGRLFEGFDSRGRLIRRGRSSSALQLQQQHSNFHALLTCSACVSPWRVATIMRNTPSWLPDSEAQQQPDVN